MNTRVSLGRALALAALLGVTACAGSSSSDPSPAKQSTQSKARDAGPPGTFSEIYDLIFPDKTPARCSFCHSMPASQVSNGMLHTGMTRDEAYAALINHKSESDKCKGRIEVVPGSPEKSLFFEKISSAPSCGNRMPVGAMDLSKDQIEMIRSWIAAGAKDD